MKRNILLLAAFGIIICLSSCTGGNNGGDDVIIGIPKNDLNIYMFVCLSAILGFIGYKAFRMKNDNQ